MNDGNLQTHEIVVYANRKRVLLAASLTMLACLFIGGIDAFAIWAFWNHYEIDTGAYVAAFILPLVTVFMGWFLFIVLSGLRLHSPAITINLQGFSFLIPLRFAFVPRFRQSFLPWEEIEWIALSQRGMFACLSLSLKDPARYWSLYGHGPFRPWRRDALTGAHINIAQSSFSLSARQILQQVQENYSSELFKYEVKIRQ